MGARESDLTPTADRLSDASAVGAPGGTERSGSPTVHDPVQEASEESFPASDAPAWSSVKGLGPPAHVEDSSQREQDLFPSHSEGFNMQERRVTLPELALLAGTRVVLGAGLGLLLAGRLTDSQRRAAGWALAVVGALSTIPLAIEVLGKREALPNREHQESMDNARTANMPA